MRGLHRGKALRAVNTHWELAVEFHKFVTFALEAGELSASNQVRLTPVDRASNTYRVKRLGMPQRWRGRCDQLCEGTCGFYCQRIVLCVVLTPNCSFCKWHRLVGWSW